MINEKNLSRVVLMLKHAISSERKHFTQEELINASIEIIEASLKKEDSNLSIDTMKVLIYFF